MQGHDTRINLCAQDRSNVFMHIWISVSEESQQIYQEELKDLAFFQLFKEKRDQDTGTQSQEETWTQAWLEEQHQGRARGAAHHLQVSSPGLYSGLQRSRRHEETHQGASRGGAGETVSTSRLQQGLHDRQIPAETRQTHPHRGEELHLWRVWPDVQAEEASVSASDASLRSQAAAVWGVRLPVPSAGLAQVSHDQAQGGGGPGVCLCDLWQTLREGTQSERAHVYGASSPAGRQRFSSSRRVRQQPPGSSTRHQLCAGQSSAQTHWPHRIDPRLTLLWGDRHVQEVQSHWEMFLSLFLRLVRGFSKDLSLKHRSQTATARVIFHPHKLNEKGEVTESHDRLKSESVTSVVSSQSQQTHRATLSRERDRKASV